VVVESCRRGRGRERGSREEEARRERSMVKGRAKECGAAWKRKLRLYARSTRRKRVFSID
jgi:hypothetical protein